MSKIKVLVAVIVVVVSASFGFRKYDSISKNTSKKDLVTEVKPEKVTKPEWVSLYDTLELKELGLSDKAFQYAWYGIQKMRLTNPILAIADFSQSSQNKRLYVIDLLHKKIVMHTYVAHGRNSGEKFATKFSNENSSYQSSLGFYRTLGTYIGKHGLSLKLEGIEKGINDRAYERAIVMHGADYVSESFIKNTGRLGRSQGCPAVSVADSKKLIKMLCNGAGLFIYSMDSKYLKNSKILAGLSTPETSL